MLLFREAPGMLATAAPGRMGPPASISFTLLGVGVAMLAGRSKTPRLRQVAPCLGLAVIAIALLSLIGYLFGARTLFTLPHVTGISMQTATMVLALGMALVAAATDTQPALLLQQPSAARALARRALPFVFLLPALLGWLYLRGQEAGFYDPATGLAILILALTLLLCVVLWWGARSVRRHELRQDRATRALAFKEREERRQRQFLGQLIASSPVAIAIVRGEELRYELVNPAYQAIAGTRALLGRSLPEVFPEMAAQGMAAELRRVLATGQSWQLREFPTPIPDRAQSWWDGEVVPLHDADGAIDSALILTWQVTQRKEAEAALRQSRERLQENAALFRTLGEAVPDFLWMADAAGDTLYQNPAWVRYTGLTVDELRARGWEVLHHEEDLPELRRAWAEAQRSGTAFAHEARYRRHDGVYRWFSGRTVPVHDEQGVVVKWVGTATDIDDRKRTESERERLLASERAARATAEQAAQLKDEFLAVLSHELRTPLNAILGWSQLLRNDLADADKASRAVDVIERNARVQTQLIADLLDLSSIVTGKMRIDLQRVDLAAVTDAAIQTARPAAEAKGVIVQTVFEPRLAAVHGDPARLQQVVWNLLANAVKFTPRGGRVTVSLSSTGLHAVLTVSDTGEGIATSFLPHVFERFRQADASTSRQHGGLGIGLALVKQLVELHGGSVRVHSAGKGSGATFVVELPFASAAAAGSANPPPPGAPAGGALELPVLAGVNVLLVDDEPDALDAARQLLQRQQARVTTATGTDDALRILAGQAFDVIVSDIAMPHRDGYEFVQELRRRGVRTPAVALTAFARTEDRQRTQQAGYQAHVTKPVEAAELLTTLAALTRAPG